MDPMMELVNALNALTAALQKFSSQTTNAYLDTFEEMPTQNSSPCFASSPRTCSAWSISRIPATTRSTHSAASFCASA